MGELTGELAEGYRRLMDKKKASGGESNVAYDASKAVDTTTTNAKTKSDDVTYASKGAKFGPTWTQKSVEKSVEVQVQQKAPSSTSGTRKSLQPTSSVAPRRPFFQESRFAKLQKQRSNNNTNKASPEKENDKDTEQKNEQEDDPTLRHVSSNVSSTYARSTSGISVETRRAGNTSKLTNCYSPVRLEVVKTRPGTSSSKERLGEKDVIDATPGDATMHTRKHAASDKDSEDSFPPLDWQEIENEARSTTMMDTSKDSDLTSISLGGNLVAAPFDPHKDNVPVASARSQRSEQRLNAILEEEAKGLFRIAESPLSEQSTKIIDKDVDPAKTKSLQDGFEKAYESIQFSADDLAVAKAQQTKTASNMTSNGKSKGDQPREERAYHRPHTGEKVFVKAMDDEKKEAPIATDESEEIATDAIKSESDNKDDVDNKSDASGLPSWTSTHSEKKKKKGWNHRPKRRPKKTPPSSSQSKDGDPLGRAVSIAFDQFAGYAGFQEDNHSVTANEAHDEYTIDEEYLSDESESIMADIHDALFSTFGCTVHQRLRQRQLNDDDTLETDGGSKVSASKFIRHARSGSDSVYSEPSLTIPSVGSYDKTDEGTHEDDATDEMTDFTKKSMQSQDPPKPETHAAKFKVPEKFDEIPPSIPKALGAAGKTPSKMPHPTVYSENTDTYRNFVEKDHKAVNLLEDADNFLFKKDVGTTFLKVANTNMEKLVASIQGFLQPMPESKQEDITGSEESTLKLEIETNSMAEPMIDSNEEVTATDFSNALAMEVPDVVPGAVAVEPEEEILTSAEPIEREDSLFAASPKDSSQSELSSETGSDHTLEELKMLLIEESQAMSPIATYPEAIVSRFVEEEKKEEEVCQTEGDERGEGFEFEETFFSKADNVFSAAMTSIEGPKITVVEAIDPFSQETDPTINEIEFGAKFGDESDDTMPSTNPDTGSLEIVGDASPDQTKPVTEEFEVSKRDSIFVPTEETVNSAAGSTKLRQVEPARDSIIEPFEFESQYDLVEPSCDNIEVPPDAFPAFHDEAEDCDAFVNNVFESVEVPVHHLSSLPSSTSGVVSKRREHPTTLEQTKRSSTDSKKNKGGMMTGLFRSFKKRKEPNASPLASPSPAKAKIPPGRRDQPKRSMPYAPPSKVITKPIEKQPSCQSFPRASTKGTIETKAPSKKKSTSDVNNLMDDYLSNKFEKFGSSSGKIRVDPWGGPRAQSANGDPKQRAEPAPAAFGEPFDPAIVTPERRSTKNADDPFGFDLSPRRNNDNSRDSRTSFETPDIQISAVMKTPDRKPAERIPNTPVKWQSVQDHFNEGIDLQASSRSTSSGGYSQPPSINWQSVLDRAGKVALEKQTPEVSPQKVADFPFISDVESHASF